VNPYRPLYVEVETEPLSIPKLVAQRARLCHRCGLTEIELSREELPWLHEYSVFRFAFEPIEQVFGLRIVVHD